jgi:hypothetical protein
MRPNPFERDVPPLNHTSNPWCWIAHRVWRDPVVLLHAADRDSAPLCDDAEEVVELGSSWMNAIGRYAAYDARWCRHLSARQSVGRRWSS